MPVSLDFVAPTQLTDLAVPQCFVAGDPTSGQAIINLRSVTWIEPAGLVAIAMFAESQAAIGREPRLFGPHSPSRARYLSRMHIGELIASLGGTHDLPIVNEHNQEANLLELQRFDGERSAERLATIVEARLGGTETASVVFRGVCEIGVNVPQHSGRQHGYIAAVTTHQTGRVSFAIGDAGVGLLESLQQFGYKNDGEVIGDLFSHDGISRTGEAGRGRGIYRTKEVITRHGGTVMMASGLNGVLAKGTSTTVRGSRHRLPGTLLQGTLPC